MAYTDCTIIALMNDDPRLCDCNKIVATDNIPLSTDQPDKQREITLKADWKYLGEVVYQFSTSINTKEEGKLSSSIYFITEQFPRSVFHPPQV